MGTFNNASQTLQTGILLNNATKFKSIADSYINTVTQEIDWLTPFILAAKTNAYHKPRWHEAMNGPDIAGY